MCTLSYIPLSRNDFLVTSNRDEGTQRKRASLPQVLDYPLGNQLLTPVDGEAGGTWIGLSDDLRIAVLLNGAFTAHKHQPPYRKSRGLVTLDAFGYPTFSAFCEDYGLHGIEPFTLVMFSFYQQRSITVLRWDGNQKHVEEADAAKPHIWMAPKLYPKDSIQKTRAEYDEFLAHASPPAAGDVLKFHEFQDYREKMLRHGHDPVPVVDTLSTSQIRYVDNSVTFHHIDKRNSVTATYEL